MPLVPCGFATKSELMLDLTVYGTLIQDSFTVEEIRECVKAEYLESRQRDLHNKPVSLSQLVTPDFIIQYQRELDLAEDEEEISFSDNDEGFDEYLIQEGSVSDAGEQKDFDGSIEEVERVFGTTEKAPFVPMEVSDDDWLTATETNEDVNFEEYIAEEAVLENEESIETFEDEDDESEDFSDLTPISDEPSELSVLVTQQSIDDGFTDAEETLEDLDYEEYTAEEFNETDFEDSSPNEYSSADEEFLADFDEDEEDFELEQNEDSEDFDDEEEFEDSEDEDDSDEWEDSDSDEENLLENYAEDEDDLDDWEDSDSEELETEEVTPEEDSQDEDDWDELEDDVEPYLESPEPPVVVPKVVSESNEKPRVSSVESDDKDFDSFMSKIPAPVVQPRVEQKPVEIDRSAEPTDIRAFVRAHPHCSDNDLTKYFTKKAIQKALIMGKIIKKGNTYQI